MEPGRMKPGSGNAPPYGAVRGPALPTGSIDSGPPARGRTRTGVWARAQKKVVNQEYISSRSCEDAFAIVP